MTLTEQVAKLEQENAAMRSVILKTNALAVKSLSTYNSHFWFPRHLFVSSLANIRDLTRPYAITSNLR